MRLLCRLLGHPIRRGKWEPMTLPQSDGHVLVFGGWTKRDCWCRRTWRTRHGLRGRHDEMP